MKRVFEVKDKSGKPIESGLINTFDGLSYTLKSGTIRRNLTKQEALAIRKATKKRGRT